MPVPVNPMQLIQMIKGGSNPQQLVMSILENDMKGNPMGQNLLTLIKEGRGNEVEQIVRNLAQQRGIDFDKEFPAFRKMLGI